MLSQWLFGKTETWLYFKKRDIQYTFLYVFIQTNTHQQTLLLIRKMEFKKVTSTGSHDFVIANGCLVFFSIEVDGSEHYFWARHCKMWQCMYIKLKTDMKVKQINPCFPHSHQPLCETEIIRQLTALVVQVLVFRESTVRVYFYMHLLSFLFLY